MKLNFGDETATTEFIDKAIVYRTESKSEPGFYHFQFRMHNGDVACTCKGWQYSGKCWHMDRFQLDNEGLAVLNGWDGVTTNQAFILKGLARQGPATARDEKWWPLSYNQVRGLLRRLRLQGLVEQTAFKHSSHVYCITPKGVETLRAFERVGRVTPPPGQGKLWE